mgnify:CR=1 FL=1
MYLLINIIELIASFLIVVLAVNQWVKHRTWKDDRFVIQQIYTRKRLFWLYVKCWVVVLAAYTLISTVEMGWLMRILVILLALLSMIGIALGENLAEVRLLQSQSENMMLRSQLNPHFLYNTLNNIDALIWLDQEKASSAVTNLSELMRYFTYSAKQERVPLGEEIEHLSQLIELQRLRMPIAEALSFEVKLDNPKEMIAPLLLLPLIENTFKHCGDLNEPGAIRIEILLHDSILEYHSNNNIKDANSDVNTKETQRKHGVGLNILRKRLDLIYQGANSLVTEKSNNRFITYLQVEL